MAVNNEYTKELIEAYFKGGNAKDKSYMQIELIMKAIKKVAEEEDKRE
ncbi:MAG: hypothetical protein KJI70_00805 [Patescibacteria group bacterium]|nr:hypothetical protein [Patescibacteria group bacterium]